MNEIIEFLNKTEPISSPIISGIVGTILTLLFSRHNARTNATEETKANILAQEVPQLIERGSISNMELYKCRNFYKIAKLADNMIKASDNNEQPSKDIDPDWVMRFFEAVGNVSNEDMQVLWAKILKGEIEDSNRFSLRTIETVHNLNAREAKLFVEYSQYFLHEQNGMIFIMDTFRDFSDDFNAFYDINRDDILLLQDCGLIGGVLNNVRIDLNQEPAGIWNDENILRIHFKRMDDLIRLVYKYDAYPLTSVGRQIFPLVKLSSNDDYLIGIQNEIDKRYSANIETDLEKIAR